MRYECARRRVIHFALLSQHSFAYILKGRHAVAQLLRLLRPTHSASQFRIVLLRWEMSVETKGNREPGAMLVEWCRANGKCKGMGCFCILEDRSCECVKNASSTQKMEESRMEKEKNERSERKTFARNGYTVHNSHTHTHKSSRK